MKKGKQYNSSNELVDEMFGASREDEPQEEVEAGGSDYSDNASLDAGDGPVLSDGDSGPGPDDIEAQDEQVHQQDHQKAKPKDDHVPLAKYLEDKNEWKRQLKDFEGKIQKYQTIEEKLNQYYAEQEKQQKAQLQAKVPTYEDDPAAYLRHQLEQRDKEVQELREQFSQYNQQGQQQTQHQQLVQQIQQHEVDFYREHPDYEDALNHVRGIELNKLKALGSGQGWSEGQMRQMLAQGELQAAYQAMQMGINPAQYAYEVAKSYGYQPKETGKEDTAKVNNPKRKDQEEFARKANAARHDKGFSKGSDDPGQEMIGRSIFEQAVAEMFPNVRR